MADFARSNDDDKGKKKGGGGKVFLALGNARPPMSEYIDPRCRVCTSPHRREIELHISAGASYKSTAEYFEKFTPPGETPVSRESISRHIRKHANLMNAALRRAMERRAAIAEENLKEMEGTILNAGGVLDGLLLKGWEAVLHHEVEFKPKDILDILDRIARMDALTQRADYEELEAQSMAFIEAVKSIVPRDMWNQIGLQWKQNLEAQNLSLEKQFQIESTASESEDSDA